MKPRVRFMLAQLLRTGAAVLLTLLLVVGAVLGWRALDAPVRVVTVSGELSLAERERAQRIVSTYLPGGVLSLDTEALQQELEQESWVARVLLRRRWPDGFDVEIEPEVPVALWRDGALLSSRGRVVMPLEDIVRSHLVRLSGPEQSSERVMATYQSIADVMRPLGLKIEALELSDASGWRFTVSSGVEVILGDSDVIERLRRVETVLRRDLMNHLERVQRVDARYDNGVAVAWRPLDADQQLADQLAQRL